MALLIALGVPLFGALLIVLAINLLAAWLALGRARRLLPDVSLPATRRHLTLTPSPQRAPAPPPPSPHGLDDFAPARQPAAR